MGANWSPPLSTVPATTAAAADSYLGSTTKHSRCRWLFRILVIAGVALVIAMIPANVVMYRAWSNGQFAATAPVADSASAATGPIAAISTGADGSTLIDGRLAVGAKTAAANLEVSSTGANTTLLLSSQSHPGNTDGQHQQQQQVIASSIRAEDGSSTPGASIVFGTTQVRTNAALVKQGKRRMSGAARSVDDNGSIDNRSTIADNDRATTVLELQANRTTVKQNLFVVGDFSLQGTAHLDSTVTVPSLTVTESLVTASLRLTGDSATTVAPLSAVDSSSGHTLSVRGQAALSVGGDLVLDGGNGDTTAGNVIIGAHSNDVNIGNRQTHSTNMIGTVNILDALVLGTANAGFTVTRPPVSSGPAHTTTIMGQEQNTIGRGGDLVLRAGRSADVLITAPGGVVNVLPALNVGGRITATEVTATGSVHAQSVTTTAVSAASGSFSSVTASSLSLPSLSTGDVTAAALTAASVNAAMLMTPTANIGALETTTVTAGAISAYAVTAATVSTGVLTSTTIDAYALSVSSVTAAETETGRLQAGFVRSGYLVATRGLSTSSVEAETMIVTGAVTSAALSTGALTAADVTATSLRTSGAITSSALSTGPLASSALSTGPLEAADVTATSLHTSGVITSSGLSTGALAAADVALSTTATSLRTSGAITSSALSTGPLAAADVTATSLRTSGGITSSALSTGPLEDW
eukprot:TRINITY_DN4524_c0_g1_i18.p1 TRINITY_DN4524_c0_g1~~TRINITY_DN4524_c0_g1_i18.p1  ORF type:complete len:805 (-),score=217.73 TRINITY_DN4524_c0_g1_i18:12-2105(-)